MTGGDARRPELEEAVVRRLQEAFPIVPRPFHVLASELGAPEAEVLAAARRARAGGRVGPVRAAFSADRTGHSVALVGMGVGEDGLERASEIIAELPHVSSAFEVEGWSYDVWLTVVARTVVEQRTALEQLRIALDASDVVLVMPPDLIVAAPFGVLGASTSTPVHLSREQEFLARLAQSGITLTEHPYAEIARTIAECGYDLDEAWVIETLRGWLGQGVIERVAASGAHERMRLGVAGALRVDDGQVARAGAASSTVQGVRWCFVRRGSGGHRELSVLVGGSTMAEAAERLQAFARAIGCDAPVQPRAVRTVKDVAPTLFIRGAS